MKKHKKYTDIIRYGKKGTEFVLKQGDYITITEKIDGSNASFSYDKTVDCGVRSYSRNQVLNKDLTLNGFYEWVIKNISPKKESLNKNYRYFGEWLTKHHVSYKQEYYNQFYLFSIYDEERHIYLSDEIVKSEAKRLGLNTVPYIYEGEFISIEHITQFIGKSNMSIMQDKGEGVVVKNIEYRDRQNKQMFIKFIAPEFSEVMGQKIHKVDVTKQAELLKVDSVVTKNRIEKTLYKLVDEGYLRSNYTLKQDMGDILKLMNSAIFEDVMKEDKDVLEGLEERDIRKRISKIVAPNVRQILIDSGRLE